ncbi:MAG: hypothetical protein CML22_07145 [Rheinheimera sp.]|nr:hypothetical protein [Rheinheimera sp.]|tara:strand:- start:1371 stop:1700 length:330 start_codon:yes stop_codon:yes gene_type:complete
MYKFVLMILLCAIVILGFAFLNEYHIANLPDDVKAELYIKNQAASLLAEEKKLEAQQRHVEITNKSWPELQSDEHSDWIVANVLPVFFSIALSLFFVTCVFRFFRQQNK